jgi:hypothetical protein
VAYKDLGKDNEMKQHELSIWWITDDAKETIAYCSKGHHDPALFIQELASEHELEGVLLEHIEHDYMRLVPNNEDNNLTVIYPVDNKRGAFPVTYYDYEYYSRKGNNQASAWGLCNKRYIVK